MIYDFNKWFELKKLQIYPYMSIQDHAKTAEHFIYVDKSHHNYSICSLLLDWQINCVVCLYMFDVKHRELRQHANNMLGQHFTKHINSILVHEVLAHRLHLV